METTVMEEQPTPSDDFPSLPEEVVPIEELKRILKDRIPPQLERAIKRHNEILTLINQYESSIDSMTPFQLAKMEHYYNKAEREAWKIAGYYKSQYQYYNGRAATERGQNYIQLRTDQQHPRNINDANYASKIKEGENLEIAGIYEGYFVTWKGIAQSYAGMQNTYKDMIKTIEVEGRV